jgi:hypothetical protein
VKAPLHRALNDVGHRCHGGGHFFLTLQFDLFKSRPAANKLSDLFILLINVFELKGQFFVDGVHFFACFTESLDVLLKAKVLLHAALMSDFELFYILCLFVVSLFLLFNYVFQIKDLLLTALTFSFFFLESFGDLLAFLLSLFLQSIHFLNIALKSQNGFLSFIALLLTIVKFVSSIFKFP